MNTRYLVIAGPIGVGKSTLTARLHHDAGFEPLFETPEHNPYLHEFYQTGQRAFETQLSFLTQRLHQGRQVQNWLATGRAVVQDRSIDEDSLIFTQYHYRQGLIDERDYQTYMQLYQAMLPFLPQPDCVICLSAPVNVLQERIHERGRPDEQSLATSYLAELNDLYQAWIHSETPIPIYELDTSLLNPDEVFARVCDFTQARSLV